MESGLYVVSTPIGNLADVTERAVEVLREADVVYAEDTRRTGRLLRALEVASPLRSLHAHNEAARTEEILDRLAGGERCALVSDAGTPAVSDPGRRVVAAAHAGGRRVVPVPGPSAVLAALAASGLEGDRFTFAGFPPRGGGERETWLEWVGEARVTVVAFEAPGRLARLLEDLEAAGCGDRAAAVGRELTKLHEEVVVGSVSELRERFGGGEVRGEVTLVLAGAPGTPGAHGPGAAPEVEAAARRLVAAGYSTRDVTERLQEALGVPRNEAYEAALEAGRSGSAGAGS